MLLLPRGSVNRPVGYLGVLLFCVIPLIGMSWRRGSDILQISSVFLPEYSPHMLTLSLLPNGMLGYFVKCLGATFCLSRFLFLCLYRAFQVCGVSFTTPLALFSCLFLLHLYFRGFYPKYFDGLYQPLVFVSCRVLHYSHEPLHESLPWGIDSSGQAYYVLLLNGCNLSDNWCRCSVLGLNQPKDTLRDWYQRGREGARHHLYQRRCICWWRSRERWRQLRPG